MGEISVEVVVGDIREYQADVLALKHAQGLYGADLAVYEQLRSKLPTEAIRLPDQESFCVVESKDSLRARRILFIGVAELFEFDYSQIRVFGRRVLEALVALKSKVEHLALTIHGPGYGLDEIEAFESELEGLKEAIAAGQCPSGLRMISFIERDPRRAERLEKALDSFVVHRRLGTSRPRTKDVTRGGGGQPAKAAASAKLAKPLVFVAMPFHKDMEDTFHFGIHGAVRAAGFICERSDQSSFVGDVMERVRQRISRAKLVVADLTGANPNVFLEVGFAWGCGRPTVLLSRDTAPDQFDVRGQRCLVYNSIRSLKDMLAKELSSIAKSEG